MPTDEDQAELKQQFERFDTNKNGFIDESEFRQLLQALGDDAPAETLSLQFSAIDGDADGVVTFEEFAYWWLN